MKEIIIFLLCVGFASALQVFPPGGEFIHHANVQILGSPNSLFAYTLDGSAPSLEDGQLYTGGFTIEKSSKLRVVEFAPSTGPEVYEPVAESSMNFFVRTDCKLRSIDTAVEDMLLVSVRGAGCNGDTIVILIDDREYFTTFDGRSAQISIPYHTLRNEEFIVSAYASGSGFVSTPVFIPDGVPHIRLLSLNRPLRSFESFSLPNEGVIVAEANYPVTFFVNDIPVFYDATKPYEYAYSFSQGTHSISARSATAHARVQASFYDMSPPTVLLSRFGDRYIVTTSGSSVTFLVNGMFHSHDDVAPFEIEYSGEGFVQAIAQTNHGSYAVS